MTGRIFLAASEYSISEREPFITVTFKRDGDTSGAVNITYGINADTATTGSDYAGSGGTVTIPAGETSVSIQIPITNDTIGEPTERFSVSLINVDSGLLLFPRTANISILDDELIVDPPPNPPQTSPYTVTSENVVSGLNGPLQIEWLPDSSIALVAEKGGAIRIVDTSAGTLHGTLIDLSAKVNEDADRGLLDIALHPDLDSHPYLYAFYVVDPPETAANQRWADPDGQDGNGNRYSHLVRYELDLSGELPTIKAGTETIVLGGAGRALSDISGNGALDYTNPQHSAARASDVDPATGLYKEDYIKVDSRSHAGGALAFGPDGALYVSTGDGTSYNYADPRTVSVQDPNSLAGKVLRIDPLTGKGLADNPFVAGDDLDANASKVWQMGLRNPYAMTFTEDGRTLISETGWYSWEEINSGSGGANFGWPYYEGGDGGELIRTPEYRSLPSAAAFYDAVAQGDITITPAFRSFSHASADPGHQLTAIVGGVTVYDGDKYPAVFKNDYFFSDIVDGDIFTVDVNDRTQLQYLTTIGEYKAATFAQGPDGYVYYTDLSGGPGDGKIVRLVIDDPNAGENAPPVVSNPIADAEVDGSSAFNLMLPQNVFNDPDNDPLELVATLAGGAPLPSWLSFNPQTRTFSGLVPATAATLTIVVTAIDPGGAIAEDAFMLTINPVEDQNSAPYVAQAISHQTGTPGADFSYVLPTATFVDPDGDALTLSATLANGQPLPSWLTFDAASRSFSGMPAAADAGVLLVVVEARDGDGARASDVFALTVQIPDPAPQLAEPLDNRDGTGGEPLSFVVPAGTFTDNGTLTYTATLVDGSPLPAWLIFDPQTGQFSGTPPLEADRLAITVTATDASGTRVADSFVLTIAEAPLNIVPVVANEVADQSVPEEASLVFELPEDVFTDADDDALVLSAALEGGAPLPAWLTFDPATRTFSGTPDDADLGTISIAVTASDGRGGTVTELFALTVTPVNDAPVAANPIEDAVAVQNAPFAFVVPAASFTDADGDILGLEATLADGSPLPAWLDFESATGRFGGTPTAADIGSISVLVTASDGKGGTVSDAFTLRVDAVNALPNVANPIVDQSIAEGGALSFAVPGDAFADVDGDPLTLEATLGNGSPLPSWLHFDPATGTFTGTPDDPDVGNLTIRVTASDGRGGSVSDSFTLTVTPVNDAPVVAEPIVNQNATQGQEFSFAVPPATFTDADGDTLALSAALADGGQLPEWLTFDTATGLFSGLPGVGDHGTLTLRVTASDGNGGVTFDDFVLDVAAVNSAPRVQTPIADQQGTEEAAFSFTLPATTFNDPDNDALSRTAALADGSPLPIWLAFDAASGTFSGTPDEPYAATLSIRVTASDGRGGQVSDTFDLTITPTNDAPQLAVPLDDAEATAGAAFTFIVPAGTFTDIDDASVTLNATLDDGSALPTWLGFNPATRTFSGTPDEGDVTTLNIRVTATDAAGTAASDVFVLRVEEAAPQPVEVLYQETNANQYIEATSNHDVFVLQGPSSGYSWGPTQNGEGVVVWNSAGFDILFGFEELRFTNRSVPVSSILGTAGPDHADDPDATQHLAGKTELDRFIIDGNAADYGWGETQSGTGVVIWSRDGSTPHDILTDFERIVFDDREVDISGIGTV